MKMIFNLNAEPFTPTEKTLSPLAKEFVPKYVIDENALFDKLERKFIAENSFIFDCEDEPKMILKCEHKEFEKVRGPRYEFKKFEVSLSVLTEEPKVKTWADIVSSP